MYTLRTVGLAAVSAFALSAPAQAAVFISTGDTLSGGTNVLLDSGEQGTTIYGDLSGGQSNVIQFSSTSDTLVATSSGQATLTSTDPTGIHNLSITSVSPYVGFDGITLNVFGADQTPLTFTAIDSSGTAYDFGITLTNGQNRYTFTTDLAYIASLSFNTTVGVGLYLDTVKQVRVGDLAVPGPIAGAGIPALMAFGSLLWARRRRPSLA